MGEKSGSPNLISRSKDGEVYFVRFGDNWYLYTDPADEAGWEHLMAPGTRQIMKTRAERVSSIPQIDFLKNTAALLYGPVEEPPRRAPSRSEWRANPDFDRRATFRAA